MARRRAQMVAWIAGALLLAGGVHAGTSMDDWMQGLEGGWQGPENETPLGRMPFALVIERTADDEMQALAAMSRETWIKLRFYREGDRWLLEQSAAMEGLGQQSSILVPAKGEGNLRRWVDPERPEYLSVDVGLNGDDLFMDVTLRGEPHAQFKLQRTDQETAAEMGKVMRSHLELGSEEQSIHDYAGQEGIPAAIRAGRRQVAEAPADAGAHMQLANALIEQIGTHPAQAPMYAGELLQTLQRALELDPKRPDVYHSLIGYYLEAPPIAGGSVEKAEELANRLASFSPEHGAAAMERVSAKR